MSASREKGATRNERQTEMAQLLQELFAVAAGVPLDQVLQRRQVAGQQVAALARLHGWRRWLESSVRHFAVCNSTHVIKLRGARPGDDHPEDIDQVQAGCVAAERQGVRERPAALWLSVGAHVGPRAHADDQQGHSATEPLLPGQGPLDRRALVSEPQGGGFSVSIVCADTSVSSLSSLASSPSCSHPSTRCWATCTSASTTSTTTARPGGCRSSRTCRSCSRMGCVTSWATRTRTSATMRSCASPPTFSSFIAHV